MVSQTNVQTKVDKGYGKAATAIGEPCDWYRPSGVSNPIVEGNLLGWLQVLLDTSGSMAQTKASNREGTENWFGGFDRSAGARIGDYLVTADDRTFFITTMDAFRASRLAFCNSVVSIRRPGNQAPGAGHYGGVHVSGETAVLSGWPASMLLRSPVRSGEVGLPGDTPLSWHDVLLPSGIPMIRPNDVLTTADNPARRFTVSGIEQTGFGWRLTALLAVP